MNSSPLFTFILAGYQTEPYLQKMLNSIENQTFRDFEVICYVEDSTDRSLEICRAMAERDPRFQVVSGPKSGAAGTTRNYGIDHAKGKYLAPLDGDDWLFSDMLEQLACKLEKTGETDVLTYAAISVENEKEDYEQAKRISNFRQSDEEDVFSGLEAIRRSGRNGGAIHHFPWLSIYRVDFLREHRLYQSERLLMEDCEWNPRVWFFAKRFAYLDRILYVYRRRPGSLTTEVSPRLALDLARQFRSMASFTEKQQIPDDILSIWGNQWISLVFWFLFHPVSSAKVSDADRKQALAILFSEDGRTQFLNFLSRNSRPKRLAYPLILLAAKGIFFPAKIYFRWFYYPMIEWRTQLSG